MYENKASSTGINVIVALVAIAVGCKSSSSDKQHSNIPAPKPKLEKSEPVEPKEPAFIKHGLVANYPFNGNAKDASGNGYDGRVVGAVLSVDRNSKVESCYTFTDGPIELPKVLAEKFGGDAAITFSGWVKCSSKQAARSDRVIFNTGESSQNRSFSVFMEKGNLAFSQYMDRSLNSNITLSDENWHHCVTTYDDGKLKLYVDGKLTLTRDVQSNRSTQSALIGARFKGPLPFISGIIGEEISGYSERWPGSIDDIRLYVRALTADEVKALYEWEKPRP